MTDPNEDPEEVENVETTAPKKPKPADPIPQPDKNWELAYKGLQRTLEKLQAKYDKQTEQLDNLSAELEELRQTHGKVSKDKESVDKSLADKDAEIQRLTQQVNNHDVELKRTKLIMTDYPDLVAFEGKGLLPTADTEENLKVKLTDFRTSMKGMLDSEIEKKLKGQGPPSTSHQETINLDSQDAVYDRMIAIAGSRDPALQAEYAQLYSKWTELTKPK
jgi:chromosome segregation ATPase